MIYHGNEGDYGTLYKLVPESINGTNVNPNACFKLPGIKEAPVVPQTVLPDISLYKVYVLTINIYLRGKTFIFCNLCFVMCGIVHLLLIYDSSRMAMCELQHTLCTFSF